MAGRRTRHDARRPFVVWLALVVAAGVVGLLGFIGFTRADEAAGVSRSFTTHLYLTVQLFKLSSGSVVGAVPWELEVARVAAPLVTASALLRVLMSLFREQADRVGLQFTRGHTVVAGLGRTGSAAVEALVARGERVVAIERDASCPGIGTARDLGAIVFVGDARQPGPLARAGVARASQLAILCGDDGTNIEIATEARRAVSQRRSGTLHVVIDIGNADLARLLCVAELERYGDVSARIDFVNVEAAGVRALLEAHPPDRATDGHPAAIAIAGVGRTARCLAVELARMSVIRRIAQPAGAGDGKLAVTVVGADPDWLGTLRQAHPELAELADLRAAVDPAELAEGPIPDLAYVCPDDDELAATAALELRARLAGHPTRIVVALAELGGLSDLLEAAPAPAGCPGLVTFGLREAACRPDVLLTGMTELLAQGLHDAYLAEAGPSLPPDDPARRPWSGLPDALRESNRDQAAQIVVKLAAVGRAVVPLTDWEAARRPFSPDEVEVMARLEHERWVAERRRGGWVAGSRDPTRMSTPYLVPWDDLTDLVRETDRLFIRRLPDLLASVGLQAIERPVIPGEGSRAAVAMAGSSAQGGAAARS